MCVEQEISQGLLQEIRVKELNVERKIRLVYPARRALSHAAKAFLELVKSATNEAGRSQGKLESVNSTTTQDAS
jgi:hypothetical protein